MKRNDSNVSFLRLVGLVLMMAIHAHGQNRPSVSSAANLRENGRTMLSATDSSGNCWQICGEKADSILLIRSDKVVDVTQRLHLPSGIQFTSILPLDAQAVLLGTASDYVYLLRHRRFVRLDKNYGLTDSSIVSMRLDKGNGLLYVQTLHSRFVLHNGSTKKDFRFIEIKGEGPVEAESTGILRHYFRKPLQKAICDVCSGIDLSFGKHNKIGKKELRVVQSLLRPGDILIKRDDYQVSNVGISGFWTHSAIYVGNLTQINKYFDGIPMLGGQKPSEYIARNFKTIFQRMLLHKALILEVIGEGTLINPLEHIAVADYFAGLRPNLPREELFRSLLTAFSYYGRPYDFLFDFSTDDAIVCSELIYKSYSEAPDKKGLNFLPDTFDGQFFYYPNSFAVQYCQERESSQPAFRLVIFYDAKSSGGRKNPGNPTSFCRTLEHNSIF
ncbi:MAG: hypothetical protein LWW85_09190 [Marinilabiliales bacterium]|nr:hypothetical protein [Marinilabiliales bacterium]